MIGKWDVKRLTRGRRTYCYAGPLLLIGRPVGLLMIAIKVWTLFLTVSIEDSPGFTNPHDIATRYPVN